MSNSKPLCPACAVTMEDGHLTGYANLPLQWVEGPPGPKWRRIFRWRARPERPVVSFRCPRCGLLQCHAWAPGIGG